MAETLASPPDQVLDPLRVPLWGSRLIEASAGTGKTWTIAGLTLRLVLGYGEAGAAFARPLVPAEILVMTFTVAATRELSDRIRSRLVEAARCFRGEQAPPADDGFLRALIDDHAPGEARAAAAWRLAMAAEAMDDSAVYTIDAWCQRMLREHAFDSGSLFDEELLADENAYVDEAARDYWRRNVYPLAGAALDSVLRVWPDVGSLVGDVKTLLPTALGEAGIDLPLDTLRARVEAGSAATLARLKEGWAERAEQMRRWLGSGRVNVRSDSVARWCDALARWAASPGLVDTGLTDAAWFRLSPPGLLEARKGHDVLLVPPWSAEVAALEQALDRLPVATEAMRLHAAASVRQQVTELKRQAGTPGFQDMLERLDAALRGPNGERLRERIVAQYPAALIDEFQDTSPLQYRIFDRIYRVAANDAATALFLIGDPKQSIFGFRGADIRSYLAARDATAGRRLRLGTNHRSTAPLVAAVNHLFAQAEARPGEGAFMFRPRGAAGDGGDSGHGGQGGQGGNGRGSGKTGKALKSVKADTASAIGTPATPATGSAGPVAVAAAGRAGAAGETGAARGAGAAGAASAESTVGAMGAAGGTGAVGAADTAGAVGAAAAGVATGVARAAVPAAAHGATAGAEGAAGGTGAEGAAGAAGAVAAAAVAAAAGVAPAAAVVAATAADGDGGDGAGAAAAGPLPFVPVGARGRSERFDAASGPVPALTFCHDGEVLPRKRILRRFADRCAEHIVTLLNDPRAGFTDAARGFARLCPADIAVLVRDGAEAGAVRNALRRRRVASVYLSDRDSVFGSPEAADLVRWLEAVASPLDSRRVRAAFATALIGLPLAELAVLAHDDAAFEARVEQLRELKAVWLRQGVLPMLRRTLHLLELPSRWLAEPDGERKLTNVLHLAELLQSAVTEVEGEETLIRWLAAQIAEPSAGGEADLVRLESDADVVKVITVFKAKGLEYPLVLLPFGCAFRQDTKKRGALMLPAAPTAGGTNARRAVFDPSEAELAAAERERQQEDLRLLYVALTRARHALWVGVAAYRGLKAQACQFHLSALGYLLAGTARVDGSEIGAVLQRVCAGVPSITLAAATDVPVPTLLAARAPPPALGAALTYSARFETDWSIGSFSRLVRDLSRTPATQVPADPALQEELLVAPVEAAPPPGLRAPRHRFPRGALPGNFLHDQLEWLAAAGFALASDVELRQRLRRRCERQGWGHRADDVVAWLGEVVTTPLPPLGVSLDGLDRVLPEMEFWFPSQALDAARIDALCSEHLLGGRPRPPLARRTLHGMVMGFADLVFEHAGRYWVLDYKSNALGSEDADYDREALESAMAEHRYDVQAALYLLALHRLLRSRLGSRYQPAQHLGGAVYLFLRGVRGPERGCCVVAPPPALLDALDAAVGAAAAEAS